MAVGLATQLSGQNINATAGRIAAQVRQTMQDIANFQQFLLATDLTAPPFSLLATDQANIKSAFSDLAQLQQIFAGVGTLATAKDFTTFTKLLWGIPVP